jgi:hypothetical protein
MIDVLQAANFGSQQVLEFESDSVGSGTPLRTLSAPGNNIATDGAGNIYLLTATSLNVYSATASGGAAPIRAIALSSQPDTGALCGGLVGRCVPHELDWGYCGLS